MRQFSNFACIDWSGAAAARTPGIAVAVTQGGDSLTLLQPDHGWTRQSVLDWLLKLAASKADILIGLDLSPALPFEDFGAYFPEWPRSPANAKALWSLVDDIAFHDPFLSVSSFVRHEDARRHFRDFGWQGDLFQPGSGRLRVCEVGQANMKLRPASCFNLVGASQVGKSSLTGMRVLHRLKGKIPVWPFDQVPETGPCIVEIYTSLAARQSGVTGTKIKVLDADRLSSILKDQGFGAVIPKKLSDHQSDSLITAAWLSHAARSAANWDVVDKQHAIAATEGWTFGVV